jgi:hypothetical protein
MPANKYTKACTKPELKAEKAAIANRDPARKKAAEKIMKREGTTSPAAGAQGSQNYGPKNCPQS